MWEGLYCPSPAWGLSPSWVLMVPGRPGPGLGAQPCPRLPGRHMRGTCAGTVPRRVADSANGHCPSRNPAPEPFQAALQALLQPGARVGAPFLGHSLPQRASAQGPWLCGPLRKLCPPGNSSSRPCVHPVRLVFPNFQGSISQFAR